LDFKLFLIIILRLKWDRDDFISKGYAMFKSWNLFEKSWLATFAIIALYLSYKFQSSFLDYFAFITGILCVVLAAKGVIWTYFWGMLNTISYGYIAYKNGLNGEMGLNLYFFLPMNFIGYYMWKGQLDNKVVQMRALSLKNLFSTIFICALGILITGYYLSLVEGQNLPFLDATTNGLSITATFLMVLRFKEQWLLYIVLNVVTIWMWVNRLIGGSEEAPMMILMWSAFLVNAAYGYYNWNKGSKIKLEIK
jgi:nicotinamide mononucleotide transporter